MAGAVCTGAGIFALLLGLFVLIGGLLLVPSGLKKAEHKEIDTNIIVDSESSKTYSDWAGGYDLKQPYYMKFHMWNLTNVNEIWNDPTGIPVYESRGPYVYQRFRTSVNVSFPDDSKHIKYSNFKDYVFVPHLSNGTETDQFTNLNPVYMAALAQAQGQGELGLFTSLSSAVIEEKLRFLTTSFVDLFLGYQLPAFFVPKVNAAIANIQNKNGLTHDQAYDYFLTAWANATLPPDDLDWTGLLISRFGKVPSNITVETAKMLLDPLVNNSLANSDPNTALTWLDSIHSNTTRQQIMQQFELDERKLDILSDYINDSLVPSLVVPHFMTLYNLTNITDIGWVQWFDQTPLDGQSVTTLWPELADDQVKAFAPTPIPFELPGILENSGAVNYFPSWQFSKRVLDFDTGLGNNVNFQAWLRTQLNFVLDPSFGLDANQTQTFYAYATQIGPLYAGAKLQSLYGETLGLFRTKTVPEWAFNCEDYIISIGQPNAPPCSVFVNHTSFEPTTVYSGKGDISKINTYIKWRNQTELVGVWNGTLKISDQGYHTELGQFAPNLNQQDPITVFDSDAVRPISLSYNGTTSLKDIDAHRYIMDWKKAYGVSDLYLQNVLGFGNLTPIKASAPIYLSLFDMMGVANTTRDKVKGLKSDYSSEDEYNTVLIVEPTTGNTIQSNKRSQINVRIGPSSSTDFNGGLGNNPPVDIFYPMIKVEEAVVISDDLAHELRGKLGEVPKIKKSLFWVCVIIGPALIVLGLVLIYMGIQRRRQNRYMEIN